MGVNGAEDLSKFSKFKAPCTQFHLVAVRIERGSHLISFQEASWNCWGSLLNVRSPSKWIAGRDVGTNFSTRLSCRSAWQSWKIPKTCLNWYTKILPQIWTTLTFDTKESIARASVKKRAPEKNPSRSCRKNASVIQLPYFQKWKKMFKTWKWNGRIHAESLACLTIAY